MITLKTDAGEVTTASSQAVASPDGVRAPAATARMSNSQIKHAMQSHRAPLDLGCGDWVGEYRILEELGQGGMGAVFLAEQRHPIRRRVALKVIKLGMDTRDVVARFEAERQAIAMMSHPNVAAVLDAGATETGRPYFVMEHVPGVPITEYCDEHRLDLTQRLDLFQQACEGIHHAHQKGIIHRDIKPGNVLVAEKDGRPVVKVIDFGVAKSTNQRLAEETIYTGIGVFIGTPNYTSPEQARVGPADIDTRTDVYSLGVMLYELLVGDLPFNPGTFNCKSLDQIQRIIRECEPPCPRSRFDALGPQRELVALRRGLDEKRLRRRLRGDVASIVLKAMEKDRGRRYPSAFAMAMDVQRYLKSEPVEARAPSGLYRFGKFAGRHRVGVAVSALLFVSLILTSVAMTGLFLKARQAEQRAQQEARAAQQVAGFLTELFEVNDPNQPRGQARGTSTTARELLDRGAARIRTELADEPQVRASLMRTMAEIYEELGLLGPAESLAGEALAVHRRVLNPMDVQLARTLNTLANVQESRGRYEDALSLYRQALAINEAFYGSEHPAIAGGLGDIGSILEKQGRLTEASSVVRRSLGINRRSLGEEHVTVASDLNDLGNILESQERFDEALQAYQQAADINRRQLGPGHPEIAGDLSDIGSALSGLERHEEAAAHYRRALLIAEPSLGSDHPDVAEILHGLAEVLIELDRPDEAATRFEGAYRIRLDRFGSSHDETVESALALSMLYLDEGEIDDSDRVMASVRLADSTHWPEELADDLAEDLAEYVDLRAVAGVPVIDEDDD